MRTHRLARLCLGILFFVPLIVSAENPRWIWHNNHGKAIQPNEVRYFRKTFTVNARPAKALLSVAADDGAVVYINGKEVANFRDYTKPVHDDVAGYLTRGRNVIAIEGKNELGDQ